MITEQTSISSQEIHALTKSYFNFPVAFSLKKKDTEQKLSIVKNTFPSLSEVHEIVAQCKKDGFDIGAIVIKREQEKRSAVVAEWGIVKWVKKYLTHKNVTKEEEYAPIEIQWVVNGKVSCHWPKELFVIQGPITEKEIDEFIAIQKD